VVFAATVGLEPDRLIARYGRLRPTKALLVQAIGAERIEAVCDAFCADIANQAAERGLYATRRFSPGYGDLPLSFQADLFSLLACEKAIGLTLTGSGMMVPTKSVTALIGVATQETL
jgi:cobalamin-dependent methionine synthase I